MILILVLTTISLESLIKSQVIRMIVQDLILVIVLQNNQSQNKPLQSRFKKMTISILAMVMIYLLHQNLKKQLSNHLKHRQLPIAQEVLDQRKKAFSTPLLPSQKHLNQNLLNLPPNHKKQWIYHCKNQLIHHNNQSRLLNFRNRQNRLMFPNSWSLQNQQRQPNQVL